MLSWHCFVIYSDCEAPLCYPRCWPAWPWTNIHLLQFCIASCILHFRIISWIPTADREPWFTLNCRKWPVVMQGLRTCASRTTPHQLNTRIFRNTKNSNMKTEIKTIQQFDLIFLFAPFHRTQVQVGSNHCNWVAMSLCHSVWELWLKPCECWPY